jgi:hypothetical protein
MRSTSGCKPRPARQTAERSYLAAAAAAGKMWVCGYNRARGAIRSGGDGTGCGQQAGGGETVRRNDQDHQLLLPPDLRSRLPPDHPARLVNDLVEHGLDLANIYACYTEAPLRPVPTARRHSIRGGVLNEASSGVHSRSPITPSHHPSRPDAVQGREAAALPAGLLLACRPRMEPEPLRLRPRASHPAVTRDARRGGDRLAHRPEYYTFDISRTSKRCLPLVSCTVTSHITRRSLRVRGGPARVMRRPTPTSRPDPLAQRLGQPGHVRQIGQQPRPACDAPPRPSVVTVVFGRLVVGCTCEVPLQLVFLVPQQDQNPRQDKHFRAFTARVAPLDQAAAANSRASSPA